MANISPGPWRVKDYTSIPQDEEAHETFSEHDQGPGKEDRVSSPSWEPSQQDSPYLSTEHVANDDDPAPEEAPNGRDDWNDDREKSKSSFYLFLLTISIGGLQIAYAVEMSNGSPYLLSLGMSKSLLALVWIAGPLSGTVVQPYIGIRSDNSRLSWGKRRPFMLAGAGATALALLLLASTREIVQGFLSFFGADPSSRGVQVSSIVFATALVYILDVGINTVQAGIRAFIVDNAPTHQQEDANAWAGRLTGVGNILGFVSGYIDLPKVTGGVFGDTQFKVLCVIASFALLSTVILSCLTIHERDPRLDQPTELEKSGGVLSFFRQIFRSTMRLSPQIRKVCQVQFFNWMGWFPFLFYITTYIGQIVVNPYFAANHDLTPEQIEEAWQSATRVGTFAMLIFAITSLSANLLLPFLIAPTYQAPAHLKPASSLRSTSPSSSGENHDEANPRDSHSSIFETIRSSMLIRKTREFLSWISRLILACRIPWLTLRRAWLLSHLCFALCMLCTFLISSVGAATVMVGVVGFSWALTLWAPFALISAEISKRDMEARRRLMESNNPNPNPNATATGNEPEDQAGVVLGLHNVAISAPQIFASLVCSVIFKAAQRPRGTPGDESTAWVLRFGGLAALVAAYMTYRVDEEGDKTMRKGKGKGRRDIEG